MSTGDITPGAGVIGVRLSLAGPAGRRQVTVAGWLTSEMLPPADGPVAPDGAAQPAATPHLAFVLRDRLAGPGASAVTALAAVGSVHAGLWLGDGAPAGPAGPAGVIAISPAGRAPAELDLTLEACLVEVDGRITDSATGAAVAGHPATALAAAVTILGGRGLALEPGWIVLTGGMTEPIPAPSGAGIAVHFTSLGSIFLPGSPAGAAG